MKLPRYLQLTLLATVCSVAWSQFNDDEPERMMPTVAPKPSKLGITPIVMPPPVRVNLFPHPLAESPAEQTLVNYSESEPITPHLPLQALGAWWSQNQRIILLTDGIETWPVCKQCKAEGKIWIGNEPVSGWLLKAVEKDHLLFEWRHSQDQRKLNLSELQLEPTQ